jgi:hypothetical protein
MVTSRTISPKLLLLDLAQWSFEEIVPGESAMP